MKNTKKDKPVLQEIKTGMLYKWHMENVKKQRFDLTDASRLLTIIFLN